MLCCSNMNANMLADTEHDWREGTEQYKFVEHCLALKDHLQNQWGEKTFKNFGTIIKSI